MFFSEYGTNLLEPRLFQETTALYSPHMSRVFSGGCVYQFWQAANRYGLVEMRERDTEGKFKIHRPVPRVGKKVAEKRETSPGLLLIYHDFVNYKTELAAARDVEANWTPENEEETERGRMNMTQLSWPWEPGFQEPDSCVDWMEVEERLSRDV